MSKLPSRADAKNSLLLSRLQFGAQLQSPSGVSWVEPEPSAFMMKSSKQPPSVVSTAYAMRRPSGDMAGEVAACVDPREPCLV